MVGAELGFKYLDHPAHSPNLNPIENCWALLKGRYQKLPKKPTTVDAMFKELRRIWDKIPQATIDRIIDSIIDSMPRRIEGVRKRRGFATKY